MATKKDVLRAARRWEVQTVGFHHDKGVRGAPIEHEIVLETTKGFVFGSNKAHSYVVRAGTWPQAYAGALTALERGTTECAWADCDVCHE